MVNQEANVKTTGAICRKEIDRGYNNRSMSLLGQSLVLNLWYILHTLRTCYRSDFVEGKLSYA